MTEKKILKYESMAKLNLSDDTRRWAMDAMNQLEESFKELQEFDAGDITPLINVLDMQNVLRDDVSKKFITRDVLLSNAPEEYDGYFQVPKTLD
jgi:aspartyl-tRNA(Asn)/glutamyl-tRNA(Gln) amidotransferase subunit C